MKSRIANDLNKALEVSQMSLWTGWTNESTIANIVGGSKKVSQINERLRLKDKEELAEEIVGLRINNNI